ncbi:hypothetical protein lerEdw1_004365 [Lerista edwardsae]|nr:hypothetical protein lerEdw1_004365 [Lerista edwardsae]
MSHEAAWQKFPAAALPRRRPPPQQQQQQPPHSRSPGAAAAPAQLLPPLLLDAAALLPRMPAQLAGRCGHCQFFEGVCLSSLALHWNETAGDIERTPADEDAAFQQTNSSSSKNNSHSSAFQKEITLPSRLVYYLNRDSESPYHILDTRTRHQQKHNKAVHLAQATFQIEAFGSTFILDLSLNNDLLSSDYVEIHYEDGKPQYSKVL